MTDKKRRRLLKTLKEVIQKEELIPKTLKEFILKEKLFPKSRRITKQKLRTKPATKEMKAFLDDERKMHPKSKISEQQLKALYKLYFDEKFLFGRDRLFQYIKSNEPYAQLKISKRQVNRFLLSLPVNQLYRDKKTTLKDIQIHIAKSPWNRLQIDLIDMTNTADRKFKYILSGIDTFSKYGFGVPLISKDNTVFYQQ